MVKTAAILLLLKALLPASYLARLDLQPVERTAFLAEKLPVYKDLGTCIILPLSEDQLASLQSQGWQVEVLDAELSPGDYFFVPKVGLGANSAPNPEPECSRQGRQGPVPPLQPADCTLPTRGPASSSLCLGDLVVDSHPGPRIPGCVLWENDRLRLVRLPELDARAAKAAGLPITQLRLVPRPLPSSPAPLPPRRFSADTTVARLVSLVSQDSLIRTIQDLEDFGTRYSYNLKCESAALYLRTRLTDLGYDVRLDTYYLTSPTTRAFNVEATLPGLVVPESMLVACGHFDSYNGNNQNDAPGADDNATGTAAVIELARVLRQAGFRWSVKFLCFSGEEQWMKGSYHWVDSTAVPESLKIAGAYNLDMFGYAAYDTNLVFINTNTASRPLANLCDSTNDWYSIGLRVMNYLDEDVYGDNTPFWEAGYASVFALEDSEWGIWNGSNPHYHTEHDTLGNLTMSLVTRTTMMAAACLATLAAPIDSVGVEETTTAEVRTTNSATIVRGVLSLQSTICNLKSEIILLDVSGRKVLDLKPGANNVGSLAPGVYFIRGADPGLSRRVVKVH
ncbi:Zn-dependent exopeptidase M28 [candidate division WOR-3 bacterium]|uniref:Zn-dependent exopeptidase M28 n=1 Tax=candidate division WOR-3 bacterium TaxID=2052148 RepID=A0A938BQX2_UNCW3|nr:Zn-dependent exopeptidase M28 [candidate division WOR-3 bacterium]